MENYPKEFENSFTVKSYFQFSVCPLDKVSKNPFAKTLISLSDSSKEN